MASDRGKDGKAARAREQDAASGEAVSEGECEGAMADGEVEGTGSDGLSAIEKKESLN